ncbi:MAG: aminopeptidase [Planctomycetaceae bacterium]|nr:aminopeptidase [Planctomycetaceae bacterium]
MHHSSQFVKTSSATFLTLVMLTASTVYGQAIVNNKNPSPDAFRQLDETWPTANSYRTASGAPGHEYWQQKVDYDIDVELHDDTQRITGSETITYTNQSPDTLNYLWLQLDANRFHPSSNANAHHRAPSLDGRMTFHHLESMLKAEKFPGGTRIEEVTDAATGRRLSYRVVGTNMRVDLPQPLVPKTAFRFRVSWNYNIPDATLLRGRGGFEHFEKDGNNIYEIAQWFPRLCAYSDVSGWQHKEFLGQGEFALEFGDYNVRLTVPADHIVAATGELQNPNDVLTEAQRSRLEKARTAERPVFIVTPEEALENQKSPAAEKRTWIFHAPNVRDFAFASSRKFIWDAMGHNSDGNRVLAMSYYPNEAEPLWSRYSTQAIVHTLDVYSKYTFRYPYPVAISVNGPVYGMEYPMICFNGPRPEEDGTYSKRTKYALISVVIHEVGHNYFPMIVNTDERQWTWMDEGLNTFLQYLSEVEWEENYPSRSGEPSKITGYMKSTQQVPIMTNSESILQFGPNAYSKPATALNILRETILGRDVFDFAFREYSRRWMFRRPYPADFFRSMEDASGVDLDWFWKGWFYSTNHVDIAITNVRHYQIDDGNPARNSELKKEERDSEPVTKSQERNQKLKKRADEFPELKDFYNSYDDLAVSDDEKKKFQKYLNGLKPEERRLLGLKTHFYIIDLENIGGLVMPIILQATHDDGSTREIRLPAEIWTRDSKKTSRLVMSQKPIVSVKLDPRLETADTDTGNNVFPPVISKSRFQLYRESKTKNEMQKAGHGKKTEPDAEKSKSDEMPSPTDSEAKADEPKNEKTVPEKKPETSPEKKMPRDTSTEEPEEN